MVLETNVPTSLFIAVSLKDPNPLPDDFLDSQEVLSVLKISKSAKVIDGVVKAKESIPYRIYKKNFIKGHINISLKFPPKIVGTRLIVFYAIDPSGPREPSCGGEEVSVSNPDGDHFSNCEASSSFPGGEFDCQYAFS